MRVRNDFDHTEPENELLAELFHYLVNSKLSQEEAAWQMGVAYVTLNRWMMNRTKTVHPNNQRVIRKFLDKRKKK